MVPRNTIIWSYLLWSPPIQGIVICPVRAWPVPWFLIPVRSLAFRCRRGFTARCASNRRRTRLARTPAWPAGATIGTTSWVESSRRGAVSRCGAAPTFGTLFHFILVFYNICCNNPLTGKKNNPSLSPSNFPLERVCSIFRVSEFIHSVFSEEVSKYDELHDKTTIVVITRTYTSILTFFFVHLASSKFRRVNG